MVTFRMRWSKNSWFKDNFLAIGWIWEKPWIGTLLKLENCVRRHPYLVYTSLAWSWTCPQHPIYLYCLEFQFLYLLCDSPTRLIWLLTFSAPVSLMLNSMGRKHNPANWPHHCISITPRLNLVLPVGMQFCSLSQTFTMFLNPAPSEHPSQ